MPCHIFVYVLLVWVNGTRLIFTQDYSTEFNTINCVRIGDYYPCEMGSIYARDIAKTVKHNNKSPNHVLFKCSQVI